MDMKIIKNPTTLKDLPLPDCCSCGECGWSGKISKCNSYADSEDWEGSETYIVHECPKCEDGGMIGNYYVGTFTSMRYMIKEMFKKIWSWAW